MCVVIDSNKFSDLLNPQSSNHTELQPLRDWISNRNGKIVYGGSKYLNEIKNHEAFRAFLYQMEYKGKTVKIDYQHIDMLESFLASYFSAGGLNDHHIVAITLKSGCKVICSDDQGLSDLVNLCYSIRSRPILSKFKTFAIVISKPKIYKRSRQAQAILCDRNIANCCKYQY